MIEVRIPLRLRSQVHRASCHWAVRNLRVREIRSTVSLVLARSPRPSLPCLVTLARISPGELDSDNLHTVLKPVRDEVAVWLDLPRNVRGHAQDNDPRVSWRYQQGHDGRREYAVIIRAETVEQAVIDAAHQEELYR